MEFSIAVPLTHLFLAMLAAFGLPIEIKDCKMDWEGYTTTISKTVEGDTATVSFTTDQGTTKYMFKASKVSLTQMVEGADGKQQEAGASYDLKKEFGIDDPKQLANAAEAILRANGTSVTLRLERGDHELSVTETNGNSPGVFGYTDKKFPPAKFKWK